MMHMDAGNVEILNFGNFENLEIWHHERDFPEYVQGVFSENDDQHIAKNIKDILLYNSLLLSYLAS